MLNRREFIEGISVSTVALGTIQIAEAGPPTVRPPQVFKCDLPDRTSLHFTYVVPAGVTSILIEAVGGGGGGAAGKPSTVPNTDGTGGPGGEGCKKSSITVNVAAGDQFEISLGKGGDQGHPPETGGPVNGAGGGQTLVLWPTNKSLVCEGGGGAGQTSHNFYPGGGPGQWGTQSPNFPGGTGGNGGAYGGGGGASDFGKGGNGGRADDLGQYPGPGGGGGGGLSWTPSAPIHGTEFGQVGGNGLVQISEFA